MSVELTQTFSLDAIFGNSYRLADGTRALEMIGQNQKKNAPNTTNQRRDNGRYHLHHITSSLICLA